MLKTQLDFAYKSTYTNSQYLCKYDQDINRK